MAELKRGTYLTGLRLRDVKSFKGEHMLNLCDGDGRVARWTLLLGENGVGKTTLLQCLAYLAPFRNTDDADVNKNPTFYVEPIGAAEDKAIERLGRHGAHESYIEASFVANGQLGCAPTPRVRLFSNHIDWTRKGNKIETFEPSKSPDVIKSEPLIIGYGAGRKLGRNNLDPAKATAPLASIFDEDAELVDAEELIQQLDYAALRRKSRRVSRQYAVLKQMIASLLPDVGEPGNIIVHGPSPLTQRGKVGVHAKTPYGEVPLADLSFGYQTMTAWLADIAWRLFRHYPESSNPLLMPAIILVDEIDLHLHPRWQRQLRDRLARHFPAVQFIATAHSPLMAQAYMSENLAVIRRIKDQVVIENEPRAITGWRLDQVITSELFGLESPYSPDVERLLEEQEGLAARRRRSAAEQARLDEIGELLLDMPREADPDDSRAMDIIRRAATLLGQDTAQG